MLQGKGMFIWQVDKADRGNAATLVSLARAAGLTHVIIKIADGTDDFPKPSEDPGGGKERLTDQVIRAFQDSGIAVWGLTHLVGDDPVIEAHRAASRVMKWRLSGLVINPQYQYTGQHEKARQVMAALRTDLGNDPERLLIAFSLFRNPDLYDSPGTPLAQRFPVDDFVAQCDLVMPQVFWIARDGGDPVRTLNENHAQYVRRYPEKPYVPTGAAFGQFYGPVSWSATPSQIEMFLNQVRALDLPAANFWSWQHARNNSQNPIYTGTQLWDAVARYPWPVEGSEVELPIDEDNVEIVIPGESRYLDGIYRRVTNSHFSVMQSEQGLVKYASTHPTRSTLWAQWTPGIGRSGRYEIAAFVPADHATTRRARYHVRGIVGQQSTVVVTLDQDANTDRFVPLGIFELDGARPDSGAVNLNNLTGEAGRELAFGAIRWRLVEEAAPVVALADGYDAPVGTPEERAAAQLWPGNWVESARFAARYNDNTSTVAFHTGSDLNLNMPQWDADRGAPVYAMGSGTVVFVGQREIWGNLIVIRHNPIEEDGNFVWARYAHVEEIQVSEGQQVNRGQQIAVVGKPEPRGAPYHLHFDVCRTDLIEEQPDHWPQQDHRTLLTHYLNPRTFIETNRPPEHLRGR